MDEAASQPAATAIPTSPSRQSSRLQELLKRRPSFKLPPLPQIPIEINSPPRHTTIEN